MGEVGQSFEDAAFALVQALSPGKRLSKEQIPYSQLKGLINQFVSEHHKKDVLSVFKSTFNCDGSTLAADERNTGSAVEASDDSCSRLSFEDNFSVRTKSLVRAATFEHDGVESKSSPRSSKQIKKMRIIRSRRRIAGHTEEFTKFDCAETELSESFKTFYRKLVENRSSALECFHIIINSLTAFFGHSTWTNNVENLVKEFLSSCVLKTCSELGAEYDARSDVVDAEKRILEYEVMILIELHLISGVKELGDFDVVSKLRFIYFAADAQRMRVFLDETIADQFAHFMPEVITRIYEELCLTVPCDLEEYENGEQKCAYYMRSSAVDLTKESQSKSLRRLLNEEDSDDSESFVDNKTKQVNGKADESFPVPLRHGRRSIRSTNFSYNSLSPVALKNGTTSNNIGDEGRRHFGKRSLSIPETPKSKMKRKRPHRSTDDNSDDHAIVVQTPIEKISKVNRRKSEKLLTLLEQSESSLRNNSSGGKVTEPSSSNRLSTRSTLPSSFLPTPVPPSPLHPPPKSMKRIGSAKLNLQAKLVNCVTSSNRVVDAILPSSSQMKTNSETLLLEKRVVDRYRRRIEGIRQWARRTDANEIFYGRCATRRNLFVEAEEEDRSPTVVTRSASSTTIQKNRSGRCVYTSCVHMAHALLNVHNSNPLSPCKAPKNSPFKLHRLIRPATKADRKRLSKLRSRFTKERSCNGIVVRGMQSLESSDTLSLQS